MPAVAKNRIWCTCCKKFLTRKREREHRQAASHLQPHTIPPVTSYRQFTFLATLFSDDEDDIPALATVDHREDDEDLYHVKSPSPGDGFEETSQPVPDPMDVDDLGESEVNAEACADALASDDEDTISHSYMPAARAWMNSDSEDDIDDDLDHNTVPQEDPSGNDEVDAMDWDALEKECGLSAWDQLGESYEADAAGIGMLFW
jgi:hypothetical protein